MMRTQLGEMHSHALCENNDFLTWKIKTNVTEISLDEKIHIIFSANHKRDNQQLFCPISLELAKNAHITEHSQHQSKNSEFITIQSSSLTL